MYAVTYDLLIHCTKKNKNNIINGKEIPKNYIQTMYVRVMTLRDNKSLSYILFFNIYNAYLNLNYAIHFMLLFHQYFFLG